jgi:arylsulfatase A-like enzyme
MGHRLELATIAEDASTISPESDCIHGDTMTDHQHLRAWIVGVASAILCAAPVPLPAQQPAVRPPAVQRSPVKPAEARPPNIIFILADDLGYGDIGVYGQTRIATPNIDRLAAEGMRFTQAYAGSSVCAPSRATLMLGQHTGHARVRNNTGAHGRVPLRPDDVTVAEVLKQAGYRTGIVGKWGLGEAGTRGVPNHQGFDEWFGYLNQNHALRYFPEVLWRNEGQVFPGLNQGGRHEAYSQDLFTTRALDFIADSATAPFFLYAAYTLPHADSEMSRNTGDGYVVPDYSPYADRDWPRPEKGYAAMVTRLDRDVGRIVEQVRSLGLEHDTLIIFSSDNGPAKEGTHTPDFFKSAGPFRGMKNSLYEGGIRVPFIARWPGRVKAGGLSDRLVAFWDFLPTAAELAGLPAPPGIDGVSFAPALLGGPASPRQGYLYWELSNDQTIQAIRLDEWKGVRTSRGAPIALYRLTDDPGEQRDLAGTHPAIAARIDSLMTEAHTDSSDFPFRP